MNNIERDYQETETGQQDDYKLAYELSRDSNIPESRIREALSFFPRSERYEENIGRMSDAVIDILCNDSGSASQIKEVLSGIVEKVKDTRQLNETYLGHMTPQPTVVGIWGNLLASIVNANTIAREASYAESQLEPEAIRFLINMVGYKGDTASGVFTTGGTEANHTALTAARLLVTKEAEDQNLRIDKTTILASPYAHYSLVKSVKQLGGLNHDIEIQYIKPQDCKMSIPDLEEKLGTLKADGKSVMAIFAIAGGTETGLIDDFQKISDLSKKYNVRFIADGAYGAPYRISKVGNKFQGMEDAFVITVDPHKTLYTPYSTGAVLFKNAEDHAWIGTMQFAYYAGFDEKYQDILDNIKTNQGNLGQKRLGGSMGAGPILATLASIRTLGAEGYKTIYDLTIDRTLHLYDRLSQSEILYPLYKPDINLLCFGLNKQTQEGLGIEDDKSLGKYINKTREDLDNGMLGKGGYFFSTTKLPLDNGSEQCVYRACLMNPRTTNRIIDSAVGQLECNIKKDLKERG